MAERRRRRRRNSAGESEDDEEKPVLNSDMSDHEYESAAEDDDEDAKGSDVEAATLNGSDVEVANGNGSDVELEGGEEGLYPKDDDEKTATDKDGAELGEEERGAGDGQESLGAKHDKVDVDEDRRNPAYIPKRGLFYEHDDRLETSDEDEGEEGKEAKVEGDASASADAATEKGSEPTKSGKTSTADEKAVKPRRVLKSDAVDKWGHDKFMELDQTPKSSEELVQVYGYDIRHEDNAPRARRRRRYGRGPNKYTRNWEDEEAYQPKTAQARGGGVAGGAQTGRRRSENEEEFPALGSNEKRNGPSARGERRPNERRPPAKEYYERDENERPHERERPQRDERDREPRRDRDDRGPPHHGGGRGRGAPFRRGTGDRDGDRQQSRHSVGGRNQGDHGVDDIEREFSSKVNVSKDRSYQGGSGRIPNYDLNSEQQNSRSEGKPKRYSSLRPARGQGQPPHGQPRDNQGQQYYEYQNQRPMQGRPGLGGEPLQFGGQSFPNTHNSGPPPDAPFHSAAGPRMDLPIQATGGAPYINPAGGILNYGPPPPVPYTGVPVTVPIPLVHPNTEALAMIAAASHFVSGPAVAVSTQEQVLLAAAGATGGQGYAEVRGGVTYFHPTAQATASLRAAHVVSKRPKAAIPIVDPSQVSEHHNGDAKLEAEAPAAVGEPATA